MKPMLLLLFVSCIMFEGSAQDLRDETIKKDIDQLLRQYQRGPSVDLSDSLFVLNNPLTLRNKKPGIYRLPQDNMPCIVPDTSKTIRIPNAWKSRVQVPYVSKPPRIPNPARKWVPTPINHSNWARVK